jgi:hypothetical protein
MKHYCNNRWCCTDFDGVSAQKNPGITGIFFEVFVATLSIARSRWGSQSF